MRGTLVIGLLLLAACDSRDRPPGTNDTGTPQNRNDASTQQDGGVAEDSGTESDGGTLPTDPILERPVDRRYTCAPSLQVTQQTNRDWNANGWTFDLALGGGAVMFGRIERDREPFGIPTNVDALLSTLDGAGNYGAPLELAIASPEDVRGVAIASTGDATLFAYSDAAGAKIIRIEGTNASAPKTVLSPGGMPERIAIAFRDGRGAVVLGFRGADERTAYQLQAIDATGAPVGSSFEIARGARTFTDPGVAIVATAGGYALAWRNAQTEGGEIYFRLFDANAQPIGETKTVLAGESSTQLGATVGFEGTRIALVQAGDEFVLGWVQAKPGSGDMGAWAMVNLAKVDADGDLIGSPQPLLEPEIDINYVEPQLFTHGDAVGLTYSRGTHIYICAGCIPDHAIKMVLIDPVRMVPVSDVQEIDDDRGGLLYRSTISDGSDIITAFRIVFHVTSEAGIASFHCDAN